MIAAVLIPTYNEVDSIKPLLEDLFDRTLSNIKGWTSHVIVIDGNSPDGTAVVVREMQHFQEKLHLIVEEKKEGIGAAYFKGFQHAMSELHADVVIEFDGDGQHPTESIPLLLDRIQGGADLVLGSRRIKGGSYPAGWDWKRLLLSIGGGFIARFLLFFPNKSFYAITDPTTGLKATRIKGILDRLDFHDFRSLGFGYKVEMLYHLVQTGARIEEIPLSFSIRKSGESKMTGQTPAEIFRTVFLLRRKDEATRRFLKFAFVGLSGFLVNAAVLELLARTPFISELARLFQSFDRYRVLGIMAEHSSWAAALAAECSIINNFLWNNYWTFSAFKARTPRVFVSKFLLFNFTSLGAILIQFVCEGIVVRLIADTTLVRQITLVLSIMLLIIPYNWLMYNKVIWQTKRKNASRK